MEFCFKKLAGAGLLIMAAALPSFPGVAVAQSCACSPRCGLFSRGYTSCHDCCETTLADSLAGNSGESYSDPAFDLGERAPAQTGTSFPVLENPGGYIDSAVVGSQFRMRFDSAYNNVLPDRAEFFYAQCGCFGGNAPGPILPETSVDYQEFIPYLEWAFSDRFSVFAEAPARLINPEANRNAGGFSDLNAGFKFALIAHPDEYLTIQFRTYAPTGQPELGLGNGHVSLEPSVLYFRRFTDRVTLQAEFRDWIPISDSVTPNGDNFAGNVIRYGAGLGYDLYCCSDDCNTRRLTPVAELVGWTILDGFAFDGNNPTAGPIDQSGVTIVNAKFGVRYTVNQHSFYAGYGTAITGEAWYEDIFRLEYRQAF